MSNETLDKRLPQTDNSSDTPSIAPTPGAPASVTLPSGPRPPGQRKVWKLYLLLAVCIAPVVASYLMYYVFPPSGRVNYGTLIQPQLPVPPLASSVVHIGQGPSAPDVPAAQVESMGLAAFTGKWILLAIDRGGCEIECAKKLFFMRQTNVSLGKERDRLVRVLIVTDATPLPPEILAAYPGLTVLQMNAETLSTLVPLPPGSTLADHLFLIDPFHHLMMRFPEDPDPTRTRKDLLRLMRASRIG